MSNQTPNHPTNEAPEHHHRSVFERRRDAEVERRVPSRSARSPIELNHGLLLRRLQALETAQADTNQRLYRLEEVILAQPPAEEPRVWPDEFRTSCCSLWLGSAITARSVAASEIKTFKDVVPEDWVEINRLRAVEGPEGERLLATFLESRGYSV